MTEKAPFKGPFTTMRVVEKTSRSDAGYVVVDFDRKEVSVILEKDRAQFICDRLNAPTSPTDAARIAAEEIAAQGRAAIVNSAAGGGRGANLLTEHATATAFADCFSEWADRHLAAIIAKHFATPAQPAPAADCCPQCGGPRELRGGMCFDCFDLWYDSGYTDPEEIGRITRDKRARTALEQKP